MIFFVLILRLRLQRYSTNTKRYPRKKVFGNSEFCSSRKNHSRPNSLKLDNCGFGGKNKTQSFQILFSGDIFLYLSYSKQHILLETALSSSVHLFVLVKYLGNRSPKIKTKNIKNYSSILAIVNHRN